MKEIMTKYNPKRVLWLSTRITYTFDISKGFERQYNFIDYHTNKFKSDRIIIQIESLLKLIMQDDPDDKFEDDIVPSYDLIVLDELESILNNLDRLRHSKIRRGPHTNF